MNISTQKVLTGKKATLKGVSKQFELKNMRIKERKWRKGKDHESNVKEEPLDLSKIWKRKNKR